MNVDWPLVIKYIIALTGRLTTLRTQRVRLVIVCNHLRLLKSRLCVSVLECFQCMEQLTELDQDKDLRNSTCSFIK